MNRKQQYREYLRSPEWRELRDSVMRRADGNCEMCGEPAKHVHHVKYPKQFKDDEAGNLLALCESCHMRSHAMRAEKKESNIVPISGKDAMYSVRSVDHDGDRWIALDDLKLAIQRDSLGGKVSPGAFLALEKEMESDEWLYFEIQDGNISKTVKFVNEMGAARLSQANPVCEAAKNVRQFYKMLHKEHRRRGQELQTQGGGIDAAALVEIAAKALGSQLAPILSAQNIELQTIKQAVPTLRSPEEIISCRDAIIENGYDPSLLKPGTRQNLESWLGAEMRARNYYPLGAVQTRLSGCDKVVNVNQYSRGDIYRVLAELMAFVRAKQIS